MVPHKLYIDETALLKSGVISITDPLGGLKREPYKNYTTYVFWSKCGQLASAVGHLLKLNVFDLSIPLQEITFSCSEIYFLQSKKYNLRWLPVSVRGSSNYLSMSSHIIKKTCKDLIWEQLNHTQKGYQKVSLRGHTVFSIYQWLMWYPEQKDWTNSMVGVMQPLLFLYSPGFWLLGKRILSFGGECNDLLESSFSDIRWEQKSILLHFRCRM